MDWCRMKKTLTFILVCIYSFSPFSGLEGLVVCYGDDGHIELEISVNGKCGSNFSTRTTLHNPSEYRGDSLTANQDHCGPCLDIPIALASVHPCHFLTDTSTGKTIQNDQGDALNVLDLSPHSTPSIRLYGQLFSKSPSLDSLRTVVILI